MFDHVTIRVPDRAASERFYEMVLEPLGIDTSYRTKAFTEWQDFMLTGASREHPVTRGLHVAFAAPSREQVDAFWKAGTDAGFDDDGPAGIRPKYRKDYYAAFLRDPSGTSVEAVHYEGRRRRDQIIDHLWVRVTDLAASTAFYRIVADVVGLRVGYAGPDRANFISDETAASFSLLPGPPTENLHIAFPGDDAAVRRFYDDLIAAGYEGNGKPGERPRYHPGYYSAYVFDPGGNNIEVVNHHRS